MYELFGIISRMMRAASKFIYCNLFSLKHFFILKKMFILIDLFIVKTMLLFKRFCIYS